MLSPNERLDHYVHLATGAESAAAAAEICVRATADAHLHVFGELLDVPSVAALAAGGPHVAEHRLLQLFAHGTYAQWAADPSAYPPLAPEHVDKLRTLSLLSAATGRSSLAYAELLPALGMHTARELEQFALRASYSGLIAVRLDPRAERVHVSAVSGRDVVDEAELAAMRHTLVQWKAASERLLREIDAKIAHVGLETQRAKVAQARREQDQKTARDLVCASSEFAHRGHDASPMMGFPSDYVFEQIEPEAVHPPQAQGSRDRRLPSRSMRNRHEN
jgi:COP9 signalosome complex subunit 7